jgi:hypothetical protein
MLAVFTTDSVNREASTAAGKIEVAFGSSGIMAATAAAVAPAGSETIASPLLLLLLLPPPTALLLLLVLPLLPTAILIVLNGASCETTKSVVLVEAEATTAGSGVGGTHCE